MSYCVKIGFGVWLMGTIGFGLASGRNAEGQSAAKIVAYPVPDAVVDSPFEVSVDGRKLPIEQAAYVEKAYYCRFQSEGKAKVEVKVACIVGAAVDLMPERFRTDVAMARNSIAFSVDCPGPRVLHISAEGKALPKLFVIVDRLDTRVEPARGEGVFNVADYGVTTEGDQTQNIGRALDACGKGGGGTVYFGPGIYSTGTIRIGDNTRVYLAPGSVLKAADNPDLYPRLPRLRQLILFDKSKNSSLCGYGVVDSCGHKFNADRGYSVQGLPLDDHAVVPRPDRSAVDRYTICEECPVRRCEQAMDDGKQGYPQRIRPHG